MGTTVARLSSNGVYFTSNYFDEVTYPTNTSGSLSFTSSNSLQTSAIPSLSGDFAIELFFYPNTTAVAGLIESRNTDTTVPFWIGINLGSVGGVLVYTDAGSGVTSLGYYVRNGWNHLVACRKNGVLSTFLNGNLTQSRAMSSVFAGNRLLIGTDVGNPPRPYTGYMSNIRIVNGGSVYTNTYTPTIPTAPYTRTKETTMLLTAPYSLVQYTDSATTISPDFLRNPTKIQYYGDPGTGALYFNGTSDFLEINHNAFSTLDADFTIEFWVMYNAIGSAVLIQGTWTNANQINIVSSHPTSPNKISVWSYAGYSASAPFLVSTTSITTHTWYHVAVTRTGNTFRLFLNGNLEATYGSAITINQPLRWIGKNSDGTTSSAYFNGWMSNLHVVKGTSLYTAAFPMSSVSIPAKGIDDTVFLLTDPRSPIEGWSKFSKPGPNLFEGSPLSANNTSLFFNGTTDYLNFGNVSNLSLTGDFTAEFWVKYSALPGAGSFYTILDTWVNSASAVGNSQILINSSGYPVVYYNGSSVLTTGSALGVNTWHHVAVVRRSGTIRVWCNGNQDPAAVVYNGPVFRSDANLTLGRMASNNTLYHSGYLSNVRIIKDRAVYTRRMFESPVPLLSATSDTVFLLNSPYSTVVNGISSNGFTSTSSATTTLSAGFSPFNNDCIRFNGSSSFLWSPKSPDFEFVTGTFTIECWVRFTSGTSATKAIATNYLNTTQGWAIQTNASSKLTFNGSGDAADITGTTTLSGNMWYHVAVSGSTGSYKMFINGVQEGATFTGAVSLAGGPLYIGKLVALGISYSWLNGCISNFRIVNGTALYTSNFNTSAPISPLTRLTNVANTVLLLNDPPLPLPPNLDVGGSPAVYSGAPHKTPGGPWFDDRSGYSLFFNSTNRDRLLHGGSPKFNFNGDFTIECWVLTSTFALDGATSRRIFSCGADTAASLSLNFWDGSAATNRISLFSNATLIAGTIAVADGIWHHVALTRSGTTIRLFVDGVISGTATSSTVFNLGVTNGIHIGALNSTTGAFHGFINNFRIVNGTAVYTTNFNNNLPTGNLQNIPNTVILLQDTGSGITLPNGISHYQSSHEILPFGSSSASVTLSAASPFGTGTDGSMKFDGQLLSYLTYGDAGRHNFSSGIFTIECWAYFTATGSGTAIISNWNSSTTGWSLFREPSGVIRFYFAGSTSVWITGSTLQNNMWYNLVVTGCPGSYKMYVNGAEVGSVSGSYYSFSGGSTYVGRLGTTASYYLSGFVSNVRITERFFSPTSPLQSTQFQPTTNVTSVTAGQTVFLLNNPTNVVSPISSAFVDYSTRATTVINKTAVTYLNNSPFYNPKYGSNRITPTTIYAGELDEVTYQNAGNGLAKKEASDGTVYVAGYFDEVTGIN